MTTFTLNIDGEQPELRYQDVLGDEYYGAIDIFDQNPRLMLIEEEAMRLLQQNYNMAAMQHTTEQKDDERVVRIPLLPNNLCYLEVAMNKVARTSDELTAYEQIKQWEARGLFKLMRVNVYKPIQVFSYPRWETLEELYQLPDYKWIVAAGAVDVGTYNGSQKAFTAVGKSGVTCVFYASIGRGIERELNDTDNTHCTYRNICKSLIHGGSDDTYKFSLVDDGAPDPHNDNLHVYNLIKRHYQTSKSADAVIDSNTYTERVSRKKLTYLNIVLFGWLASNVDEAIFHALSYEFVFDRNQASVLVYQSERKQLPNQRPEKRHHLSYISPTFMINGYLCY